MVVRKQLGRHYLIEAMPINYKEYHPKWSLIRRLILKRAMNGCEGTERFPMCESINGFPHLETGSKVVLTIAHMDHDKNNNRFDNLRALCQRCHLDWDRDQHAMNRKYGRNWKKDQLKLDFDE
jgi:heterodisulfide reductase subunit B